MTQCWFLAVLVVVGLGADYVHQDLAGRGRGVSLAEANPRERGKGTELLAERFSSSDLAGWTLSPRGPWSVQGGRLKAVLPNVKQEKALAYFGDPRPKSDGGDGPLYGLLKTITDFAKREVGYEYDPERRLTKVKLPEVSNPVSAYAEFSHTGARRPTVEYKYDPHENVTPEETAAGALLHGQFAKLRLGEIVLPEFSAGTAPRARFEYETATGRLQQVGFPTADNINTSTSSVAWRLEYPPSWASDLVVTLRSPWDHQIEETIVKGRVTEESETLAVYGASGETQETSRSRYTYATDGRLLTATRPDGSRTSQCYADNEGCDSGSPKKGDRLTKLNVVRSTNGTLDPASKGLADYDEVTIEASYGEDNQPKAVVDGERRTVQLAVPVAGGTDTSRFVAEQVAAHFDYDKFGRAKKSQSGAAGPQTSVSFGADASGREGAGLARRIDRGGEHAGAFWQELDYDDAFNVKSVKTSQGSEASVQHDEWDRVVHTESGAVTDGRLAPVGAAECADGRGAIVDSAFDPAGHLVRERRLQDYVDPQDGLTKCRFVERQFTYNAREQLVSVAQTQLGDPSQPGSVLSEAQVTTTYEFDASGRLEHEQSRALSHPDVVTTYSYDDAGRIASVRRGQEGARRVGYDILSRVVRSTDGDQGVWRGKYDAWGRLYQETLPTGAVVRRKFDQASQPIEESTYDADPSTTGTAKLLSQVRSHTTSFGATDRVSEALRSNATGEVVERRVVKELWSGPALAADPMVVDRQHGRRDLRLEYEPTNGRLVAKRFGGDLATEPLHAIVYHYDEESVSPWPDSQTLFESVPGQSGLVETWSTRFRRDAVGREIDVRRSDGSRLETVFDRTGGAIRSRTGAGAETALSADGRGVTLKSARPNGRGYTLFVFLASNEASYINGACMDVNGAMVMI